MSAHVKRTDVQAWCAARGITLTTEHWPRRYVYHVHADIDAPRKVFRAHGLHNLGLWDARAPINWGEVMAELLAADFGDCAEAQCEYCCEECDLVH